MEEKHIIYRDSDKIILLIIIYFFVLLFCTVDAIYPHKSGRYSMEVVRYLSVSMMIISILYIVSLIRCVKDGHEYFMFDFEGIKKKNYKKILWKDITQMEEKWNVFNGSVLKIYYKIETEEEIEYFSFITVKGNGKQIRGIIKEYWKKYR